MRLFLAKESVILMKSGRRKRNGECSNEMERDGAHNLRASVSLSELDEVVGPLLLPVSSFAEFDATSDSTSLSPETNRRGTGSASALHAPFVGANRTFEQPQLALPSSPRLPRRSVNRNPVPRVWLFMMGDNFDFRLNRQNIVTYSRSNSTQSDSAVMHRRCHAQHALFSPHETSPLSSMLAGDPSPTVVRRIFNQIPGATPSSAPTRQISPSPSPDWTITDHLVPQLQDSIE
jgi:hypothetical protein